MTNDLRAELEAEVRAALAGAGGDPVGVNKAAIAKKFIALGMARASAFKWIAKAIFTPQVPVPKIVNPGKQIVFLPDVIAKAPAGFDRIIGPSGIGLIEALEGCVTAARDVMAHSRHADGKVRLGKSLVAASEHLRRTIETVAKIQESIVSIQKIEMFYEALMSALGEVSPEVRARVLTKIDEVNAKWRASADRR